MVLPSSFTSIWTPLALKIQNFCYVAPCTLANIFWRFDGSKGLHLQSLAVQDESPSSWTLPDPEEVGATTCETSDTICQAVRRNIPEDWNLQQHRGEDPPRPNLALSRVFSPAKCRTAMKYSNSWHSCIDTLTAHDNTPKTGYGAEGDVGDVAAEQWAKAKDKGRMSEIFILTLGQDHRFVRSFRFQCFVRSSFP